MDGKRSRIRAIVCMHLTLRRISLTCGILKMILITCKSDVYPGTGYPAWLAVSRRYDVGREPAGRRYRR